MKQSSWLLGLVAAGVAVLAADLLGDDRQAEHTATDVDLKSAQTIEVDSSVLTTLPDGAEERVAPAYVGPSDVERRAVDGAGEAQAFLLGEEALPGVTFADLDPDELGFDRVVQVHQKLHRVSAGLFEAHRGLLLRSCEELTHDEASEYSIRGGIVASGRIGGVDRHFVPPPELAQKLALVREFYELSASSSSMSMHLLRRGAEIAGLESTGSLTIAEGASPAVREVRDGAGNVVATQVLNLPGFVH